MGRTVPSFRIALRQEQKKWSVFRAGLDAQDKKTLDEIFTIARLHVSACMMSCNPIRIEPILMVAIFHHFKQISSIGEEN